MQLKLYAEKGSSNIVLSDGYSAKAYNKETLKNLIETEAKHTSNITIAMAITVILFSFVIIMITFVVVFIIMF